MMNDDNQMNPNKRMNKKILDEDGNEEERMSLPDPEDDDVIIYGEGDLDDLISQNSHDEDDNENQTNINLLQKELIDEYGDEDLDGVEIDDSEWNDLADDLTPGGNKLLISWSLYLYFFSKCCEKLLFVSSHRGFEWIFHRRRHQKWMESQGMLLRYVSLTI